MPTIMQALANARKTIIRKNTTLDIVQIFFVNVSKQARLTQKQIRLSGGIISLIAYHWGF